VKTRLLFNSELISTFLKKLRNDGILFILWGWIAFINYFFLNYLTSVFISSYQIMLIVGPLRVILPIMGFAFTLYYLLKQPKTYMGVSLRYVWFSYFVCLVLVNLIQYNVLKSINFELQHPVFMVLTAFAITITGVILRYKMIIAGGIIFGLLAYIASYFKLQEQILIEAIAWVIAFIIPGHFLCSRRNR